MTQQGKRETLTRRERAAVLEALRARLAGPIEDTGIAVDTYKEALRKLEGRATLSGSRT